MLRRTAMVDTLGPRLSCLALILWLAPGAAVAQPDCGKATLDLEVKPAAHILASTPPPPLFELEPLELHLRVQAATGFAAFSHVNGPDAQGRIEVVLYSDFSGTSGQQIERTRLIQGPLLRAGAYDLALVLTDDSGDRSNCSVQSLEVLPGPRPDVVVFPAEGDPCPNVQLRSATSLTEGATNTLQIEGSWPGFEVIRWSTVGPSVDHRVVVEVLGRSAATDADESIVLPVENLREGTHALIVRQVVSDTQGNVSSSVVCSLPNLEVAAPTRLRSEIQVIPIAAPIPDSDDLSVSFRLRGAREGCPAFPILWDRQHERLTIDLIEVPGCAAPERFLDRTVGPYRLPAGQYVVQLRNLNRFGATPLLLSMVPVTLQGNFWADATIGGSPSGGLGATVTAVVPGDCQPTDWIDFFATDSLRFVGTAPPGCDTSSAPVAIERVFGTYPAPGFEPQRVVVQLDLGSHLRPLFSATRPLERVRSGPCGTGFSPEACLPGRETGDQFRARAWFDAGSGRTEAQVAAAGPEAGAAFTFFDETNPEIFLKVLDGCGVNAHWWVFVSALTDVAFDLEIFDGGAGELWTTSHAGGTLAAPISDIEAFPCSASG